MITRSDQLRILANRVSVCALRHRQTSIELDRAEDAIRTLGTRQAQEYRALQEAIDELADFAKGDEVPVEAIE